MNNPTESFIRIYEGIFNEVNRRSGEPDSHRFELASARQRDAVVRRNYDLLNYVRNVRHTLAHPKHDSEGSAVQVTQAFLEEVQTLLLRLKNPPRAKSIGVRRKKIKTASKTDSLGDLADEMKQNGFSHVPILEENDVVIGVFNEAAVFDYIWVENESIVGRQMQISDILEHCSLDAGHTEKFRFVKPATTIDRLVEMFRALESPSSRLGAVFVTASGKKSEALQRLITPWDVLAVSSD